MYATCLGGCLYAFMPSLICNENALLKQPIPVNTPLYSLCKSCVVLALVTMWASLSGPAIK